MAPAAKTGQIWRFGVFEVDTRREELRRSGAVVKTREQSFRILVYLLDHPGEVVTREELRSVLWPADTFVDFDHSLNTAVMKLREALGDSTESPLYIETVPKRGYRFIAPVEMIAAADSKSGQEKSALSQFEGNGGDNSALPPIRETTEIQPTASESAQIQVPIRRRWHMAGVAVLILVAVAGSQVFLRDRHISIFSRDESRASSTFQMMPVTSAPGRAVFPVLSSDGHEIAYVWDGSDRKHFDVYVLLVGSDTPLRVTGGKRGLLGPPAWSPDGHEIAFSRCDGKDDGVYVVPALGGEERKLTDVGCVMGLPGPVAWLLDDKEMLMIDHCSAAGNFGVVLFSLATGEKQCVASSGAPESSDIGLWFSLSPDGRLIAFLHASVSVCCDIYTIPTSGGAPHQLTSGAQVDCNTLNDSACGVLMWTPDSKSIVYVSHRTTLPSLWRISTDGGPSERETTYPSIGSFSKDGRRLAYSDQANAKAPAIWRADLASAGGPVSNSRNLIQTQYPEMDAQPSPDGTRIVWTSQRTGFAEIWMSSETGGSPLQLTHLGSYSGTPRWSPEGKWIAFDSVSKDGTQIFVIDTEGRNLHPITVGPHDNVVPSWSRDGKSIYFTSNRTGSWQVWKHALESGAEVQLTEHGGFDPFESNDGRTIYFSRFDQAGIWSIPSIGGSESTVVADKPQIGYWGHWAVTRGGLYVLNTEADPRPRIEFYSFATQRTSPVLTLESQPARLQPSLSATSDGRTVFYTQLDPQSVIKMMEVSH